MSVGTCGLGFECPGCGVLGQDEVWESQPSLNSVQRRRRCKNCGMRWRTIEISIEEYKGYVDKDVFNKTIGELRRRKKK